MPDSVQLGCNSMDLAAGVLFSRGKLIFRVYTELLANKGIELEHIPADKSGFKKGMVLIRANWKNLYFMADHKGWDLKTYFKLAEKKIQIRGIDPA